MITFFNLIISLRCLKSKLKNLTVKYIVYCKAREQVFFI